MRIDWQKFIDLLFSLLFLICLFHSLGSAFFFNLAKLSKRQHILWSFYEGVYPSISMLLLMTIQRTPEQYWIDQWMFYSFLVSKTVPWPFGSFLFFYASLALVTTIYLGHFHQGIPDPWYAIILLISCDLFIPTCSCSSLRSGFNCRYSWYVKETCTTYLLFLIDNTLRQP